MNNDNMLANVEDVGKVHVEPLTEGKQFMKDRFPDLEEGCRFWLTKAPVRVYPGYSLPASVSAADKGRVLDCVHYLQPGTNMLFHRVDDEQRPLTVPLLAKRLRISERECYRFVRRMVEARVMARNDGRLYINPVYFFRGVRLKSPLFFLFEADLSAVLPAWTVEKFTGERPKRRFNAYV